DGQLRKSGDAYIQHPLHTAYLVGDLKLDVAGVVSALLHDVPEDCGVPLEEIEQRFGRDVRQLVDGVTKLSKLEWASESYMGSKRASASRAPTQAENLRKMLLAMAEDIRVVLIKLADRLHNMRTLWALAPRRRVEIATETMEIYAPLAHRLGISHFEFELEDLAFRYMEPDKYRDVARMTQRQRGASERYISRVVDTLKVEFDTAGIKANISGRRKHLYSIYNKMKKYGEQGKSPDDIYDIIALRVLVDQVTDCYSALGIVHQLWRPLPAQFDDYIANPKDSMYQSLHTTVRCLDARAIEVQIRTHEMHKVAEYGVAAHWKYKEGAKSDIRYEEKFAWLRQLLEWQREVQGAEEFVESVKTDIFNDQVFVTTPRGDIKNLPVGSTPLDFAYQIHTDLGHKCVGAKVNGRLVPLNNQLRTGDLVEILVGKSSRGPSRDWLNLNLGFLNSSNAQQKVRQWFRKQERAENIERGKELFDREMRRLGMHATIQEVVKLFRYDSPEEFYAALGCGDINPGSIGQRMAADEEKPVAMPQAGAEGVLSTTGVKVLGVGDLLTHPARCCHPVPGDGIIGYVTRARGISVHRKDCYNVLNEDEQERLIAVEWGSGGRMYSVPIIVQAWDRVGLLRDIAAVVSAEGINISKTDQAAHNDGSATFRFILETTGLGQLSLILGKLEAIPGVLTASRYVEGW
ncbi:MAG: bifunctional (p)ppGpp synthetase/guanosine-3',5'-bis(diphosphate) 3'-pyrophosphohydrolase, partial [Dehalococcoidia bacterium]|nr:bifunctional (p)ppGpp synthetase/guanosine-3',5'-bis(diphosphate) 3'-pyrophosphohydrolase [Dehalococcoidia bacterium]